MAAKHMPGDYDIEYASPWAGANYMPSVTQYDYSKIARFQNSETRDLLTSP